MTQHDRFIAKVLQGRSDANISFSRLCRLLGHLGFEERVRGSHHIFFKHGLNEILNLQSRAAKAKPYQVKQVRDIILKYNLVGEDNVQV